MPMATIAEDAGVGIGTLYRHFPDRDELLFALTERSFQQVVRHARAAAEAEGTAVDALRLFLDLTIEHGRNLLLPLHGGPVVPLERIAGLRAQIRQQLDEVLQRGVAEGSIHRGVTPIDLILFGAMLAQPLPNQPDWQDGEWERLAHRQAEIFLDGISTHDAPPLRRPKRHK